MPSSKLNFQNQQGHTLEARLDLPAGGEPLAYALFAHCFTCSKDLKAAHTISHALNQEDIAVLRFDFTGLGESEGEFADTNFSSNVADLLQAAKFLEDSYQAPEILIGHSLGGAAVLMAASHLPRVKAVATIGAPANPEHVSHLLTSGRKDIETKGEATISIGGRPFKIKKQFLEDIQHKDLKEALSNLKPALIVFHSPIDSIVGIDNAKEIFLAAKHPKSFISLDNADHLLSRAADSHYVGHIISAWARKYIGDKAKPAWWDDIKDNRVAVRTGHGLRTEMLANGFSLIADEPISLGGSNTGPTPYDFLAAALGACTSMTLRMYADRKNWPLEGVTVKVAHRKAHAQDSQETSKKLDHFDRKLIIDGDLTKEQRQRLLEIANRCPVHRTLSSEVSISTAIEEPHS